MKKMVLLLYLFVLNYAYLDAQITIRGGSINIDTTKCDIHLLKLWKLQQAGLNAGKIWNIKIKVREAVYIESFHPGNVIRQAKVIVSNEFIRGRTLTIPFRITNIPVQPNKRIYLEISATPDLSSSYSHIRFAHYDGKKSKWISSPILLQIPLQQLGYTVAMLCN